MNYVDKYRRWHHKPVTEENPLPSGNAFYYSCVGLKLGLDVSIDPECIKTCFENKQRHPGVTEPVISRDEILALYTLDPSLPLSWNFSPYPLPRFNLWLLLVQAFHCFDPHTGKLKHRNTFWLLDYDQIYRFAFRQPLSDRFYLLRLKGKYNPFWHLVHIIAHWSKPEKKSARLLRWFKCNTDLEAVENYFGPGHPFSHRAREIMTQEGAGGSHG